MRKSKDIKVQGSEGMGKFSWNSAAAGALLCEMGLTARRSNGTLGRRYFASQPLEGGRAMVLLPALVLATLLCATLAHGQVTFAGSQMEVGGSGFAGPSSMAVDTKGTLYVADPGNNRVVSIAFSSTGYASAATILDGLSSPHGIAEDWTGNLYIADTGNGRVVMLPVSKEGFGAAVTVAAGLNNPMSVAVDSAANLYVADTGNNRVVELPRVGSLFGAPVVVGTGFSSPSGIAVDTEKSLFVADTGNGLVVKVPFTAGAYAAQQIMVRNLTAPMGVSLDQGHNMYVAETGNSRAVELPWSAAANRYSAAVVLGSGFNSPMAVVADINGNAFVADGASNQVWEVMTGSVAFGAVAARASSTVQIYSFSVSPGTTVGSVGILAAGVSGLDFADAGGSTCTAQTYGVATICWVNVRFTPLGSGQRTGAVVLYDGSGNALATAYLAGTGVASRVGFFPGQTTLLGTQLSGPSGVAVDGTGNVYIADTGNNRVVKIASTGNGYGAQTTLATMGLSSPMGLALDGAGNLYVTSNGNDKVEKLPWTGTGFGQASKLLVAMNGPTTVAVDGAGTVYVADTYDNRVDKMLWTGTAYQAALSVGNYRKSPTGVAADAAGNVYFTMPYQNNVEEIQWSGSRFLPQINLAASGLSLPMALAVDGNSNLYILDSGNNRVVMLPWTGSGFGPQITVASGFNAPSGITVDVNGNLYVADTGNNQVVKVDLSQAPALAFAQTYLGSTSSDSAQTELVQNIGDQPVSVSAVSYPGSFPEDPGAANSCVSGVSLAPGNGCQLAIDFTPQAVSVQLNGTVSVMESASGTEDRSHSQAVVGSSLARLNQTISFSAIPATTYGTPAMILSASSSSGLPITYRVISGPGSLSRSGQALNLNGAGVIVIQADQPGNGAYEAAASVTERFTVAPATLTVTPIDVNAVYGAIPTGFSYKLSGFVLGQTAAQAVTGKAAISIESSGSPGAGTYSLVAAQGTLSAANYTFIFSSGTLFVTKAVLQVKAGSITRGYGVASPQFPWSLSGLVNNDKAAVVTGAPVLTCLASLGSTVGKYAITTSLGTLKAANYDFAFADGSLTVAPAVLTVRATSQSMVYGAVTPALSYTISGFLAGDESGGVLRGSPVIATKATSQAAVGTYSITATLGTLTAVNYSFSLVNGTLQVQKAVLTITAQDAAMTYGQIPPILSYGASGFVNGDTCATSLKGAPSLTATASSRTKPGNVAITAGMGTLSSANYSFAFKNATLIIGKALLAVKTRAAVMSYGATLPVLSYDLSGFVNGDSTSTVSGAPAYTTTANQMSPVGGYAIVGALGTLASSMYNFQISGGTLTVTKAVLTVSGTAISMTYGGASPKTSYTTSGFMNGETSAVISGVPSIATQASSTSSAGVYAITVSVALLSAKNYTFTAVNGSVTVNRASLMVTPDALTMTYGDVRPSLTYGISGFVNGDGSGVVSGAPALKCSAVTGSPLGIYPITGSVESLSAANYTFQVASNTVTVNPAVLTVTAGAASMMYGGQLPALPYNVSGYVHGDTSRALSGTPLLSASATSPTGSYVITPSVGTLAAANYSFVMAAGTLIVTKAALTVTADNISMPAGSTVPALTYTLGGMVNGDTEDSAANGAPSLTTTATNSSPSGSYPIVITAGSIASQNYTLTFVNGSLRLPRRHRE